MEILSWQRVMEECKLCSDKTLKQVFELDGDTVHYTKVIKIDDMEIEFEKQNPESSCKWCVYIRVRKKDNDHLLHVQN